MPRIEKELMTDWEFHLGTAAEGVYQKIRLPHDWAIDAPFHKNMKEGAAQGYRDRWGMGWYRRMLFLEEVREEYQYYLFFGGIFEKSCIWVNGQLVGGHRYGYSSFKVEVTSALRVGDNEIVIKVDNTTGPADRWYSGCGIYRSVKLIAVEEEHIRQEDVFVTSSMTENHAVVSIDMGKAILENLLVQGYRYVAILREEKCPAHVFVQEGTAQTLHIQVDHPSLWSAEEPNLYQLELYLMQEDRVVDDISMKVGIREIEMVPQKGLFVNGNMVKLKGVCLHQEVGCRGIAAKKEMMKERLLLMKEMGCNAIRAAHHTFAAEFLELCDEMGFYVYEECFDKWTGGSYGRFFDEDWQTDVDAMVLRDRNHPCIIIWGVGNEVENQAQDSMLAILAMLKNYVKEKDHTRPVTYAMNPHFKRESSIDISKIEDIQKFVDEEDDTEIYDAEERVEKIAKIAEIVDIISCNYQEQWYEMMHEKMPDKLILGTEVYQFFKGDYHQMQNFTEENPSLVPLQHDYVIGSMVWTGIDYLGESMGYPAKGWSGAPIRTNGEKKPSFYMLQSYFQEKPMVHISVMDYSLSDEGVKEHWDMPIYADHWHFPQFHKTVIPYMITTNCEEVQLTLNDKIFYVKKPEQCANRIITGFLPYQPGIVKVVGLCQGKEACMHELVTPGQAVKLAFDKQTTYLPIEEGYEALFTVKAYDEDGHFHFRDSSYVQFRIEGNALILAVDNGNLMSHEPYHETAIHMYHGCANVVIRFLSAEGTIKIWADAEGMESASVMILPEKKIVGKE